MGKPSVTGIGGLVRPRRRLPSSVLETSAVAQALDEGFGTCGGRSLWKHVVSQNQPPSTTQTTFFLGSPQFYTRLHNQNVEEWWLCS